MKKHMISLLSIGQKHIQPSFTEHDNTCLNCSTNQKHDDLLEVFGAVRTLFVSLSLISLYAIAVACLCSWLSLRASFRSCSSSVVDCFALLYIPFVDLYLLRFPLLLLLGFSWISP